MENAISNAKWKASTLARSSAVSLGEIKRIDYNWSELHLYSDTDMCLAERSVGYSAAPREMAMDIEPEDINVSDTVTVVWAIE